MTSEQRLRAAGFEPAQVLHIVTLPSTIDDDELFHWRAPDGELLTERQALRQLDAEKKK